MLSNERPRSSSYVTDNTQSKFSSSSTASSASNNMTMNLRKSRNSISGYTISKNDYNGLLVYLLILLYSFPGKTNNNIFY